MKILKEKYNRRDSEGRLIKPNFFGHVAKQKGFYDSKKKNYMRHKTSMDYLQQVVNRYHIQTKMCAQYIPFIDIADRSKYDIAKVRYYQVNRVVDSVREMKNKCNREWALYNIKKSANTCGDCNSYSSNSDFSATCIRVQAHKDECLSEIQNIKMGYSTMYYLLNVIEDDCCADIRRLLLNMLFANANSSFYELIRKSSHPVQQLKETNAHFDYEIFGRRFQKWY